MLRLCLPSAGHWIAPSPPLQGVSLTGPLSLQQAGALIIKPPASRLPKLQQLQKRPTKICCCRFFSSISRKPSHFEPSFSSCQAPSTASSAYFQPFPSLHCLLGRTAPTCMLATALRPRRLKVPLSAMASAFSMYHGAGDQSKYTLTALGRWSCLNKQLPDASKIRAVHVYDFDNTLFKTPLPNPIIWNGTTIGMISSQDVFINGGWWHDSRILAATGKGLEKEEPLAWEGWWNEKIVELVKLSMKQPDALSVLLTGRAENGFADLVKRILKSRGLEFDMVVLKPQVGPENQRFENTMNFKQIYLTSLMETYKNANEIRVYEDRPKHTEGFREFFEQYNLTQATKPTRGTIDAEVIQVADTSTTLDPVVEVAEVQRMINLHNDEVLKQPLHLRPSRLKISHVAFFTSYMIESEDTKKLLALASIPPEVKETNLKFHGNTIMICPRPCPPALLKKVGGMGSKMLWEVTGTACYENNIWAACLKPVAPNAVYHSENPVPLVILAIKKGSRAVDAGKINMWTALPPEKRFTFETTVGEKALLKIEKEDPREAEYNHLYNNNNNVTNNQSMKRKFQEDPTHNNGPGKFAGGRGGHGRGRGGQGFRGNKGGRGRGGRGRGNYYKSLDDVDPKGQQDYSALAPGQSGQPGNPTDLQNYY